MRVPSWLQAIGSFLVGWNTLSGLQLVPLPAAVLAWLVAWLSGVLTTPLEIALAFYAALTTPILILSVASRLPIRKPKEPKPKPPPLPSPWLPDWRDMRSLAMPDSVLEAGYHRAIERAKVELPAEDVRMAFRGIDLKRDPSIDFEADSHTVGRTIHLAVYHDRVWVWGPTNRVWNITPREPLWREDPSWRDLALKSWLREGSGVEVNVIPRTWSTAENESRWYAACKHRNDESRPENNYILRDGRLELDT